MGKEIIIQRAIEEIENRSFGVTEQFLEVHQVLYFEGRPKVARVDTEKADGTAVVYFHILDELFYLAITLHTNPDVSVCGVSTEPFHSVYFHATSDNLDFTGLCALTKLEPTGGWNKGDKRKSSTSVYKSTSFRIEPNPEADEFEDKIRKLLDLLEEDREGIRTLVGQADGYIQVATSFHNGNTMLGGHHLDKDIIKRLSDLNLAVDFDIYAEGNFFKEKG